MMGGSRGVKRKRRGQRRTRLESYGCSSSQHLTGSRLWAPGCWLWARLGNLGPGLSAPARLAERCEPSAESPEPRAEPSRQPTAESRASRPTADSPAPRDRLRSPHGAVAGEGRTGASRGKQAREGRQDSLGRRQKRACPEASAPNPARRPHLLLPARRRLSWRSPRPPVMRMRTQATRRGNCRSLTWCPTSGWTAPSAWPDQV